MTVSAADTDRLTCEAARAGLERDAGLDAAERRERGVVHTPVELARWAVGQVDELLEQELDCAGGLACPDVALVDPALGAGVWLAAALERAGGRKGSPAACVGLELDEGALTSAGRVLQPAADRAGWPLLLRRENTLAVENPWPDLVATRVVLGNPPWAGRTANRDVELSQQWLQDFQREPDGQPLRERRMGVLSDDYVRFTRWAAEQVRRGPRGGVWCLATNGSYLDGPVHRGMRACLMRWFDGVRVLDMGGSALLARTEQRDENLFGVRPSTALTLAWVRPQPSASCAVHYSRLFGSRSTKLTRLDQDDVPDPQSLSPSEPFYRFVPDASVAYPKDSVSLAEAMPFHREGVQTNRDAVATAISKSRLLSQLAAFVDGDLAVPPRGHFDVERARERVAAALEADPDGTRGISAVPLAYRPLQTRWLAPIAPFCHRPRPDLAGAAERSSLCLLTARKDRGGQPWHLFGASRDLADACYLSSRSSCRTRVFPTHTADGEANLDPQVQALWSERVGHRVSAEDFVLHALSVLASAAYRARFDERLRTDYPAVSPPGPAQWQARLAAGRTLAAALCEPAECAGVQVHGELPESGPVTTRYDGDADALWLSSGCHLSPIPADLWDVKVGHFPLLKNALRSLVGQPVRDAAVRRLVGGAQGWHDGLKAADAAYGDPHDNDA